MNILPQILNNNTKKLLIYNFFIQLKDTFQKFLDKFDDSYSLNKYININLELQTIMNNIVISFIQNYIQAIDYDFRNSKIRKNNYFVNKSNVERTIVTIYGTLTFKRTLYQNKHTNEYYFYVDDVLNIETYTTYDPLIRAILVNDSTFTNPNLISYHSPLDILNIKNALNNNVALIPRQTIYRFKRNTKIRKINYDPIPVKNTLYVMVDEKWIHKQDKLNPKERKYIMSKCFVTFTGIERKGRVNRLIGRHVFITSSSTPWKDFMNEIYNIYDFEKLDNINLLSDSGSWILSGKSELKLYSNNKITVNTCEFHVKQKINRSTTDKDLRQTIANIIYQDEDKKKFIDEMNKLIESKTTDARKQKVTEYKKYILKHWDGIINMKYSLCKSSMEAHIEHCIASNFSSVPKAYSSSFIEFYLKLQELKVNNINIISYYLSTYNSDDDFIYHKEKDLNFSFFEKPKSNLQCFASSNAISSFLHSISIPSF